MVSKFLRIGALLAAGAILGIVLLNNRVGAFQRQHEGMPGMAAPASAANSPSAHAGHAAAAPGERKILYWYDPMHPQYKANAPGIAPDCGMELVPKYADEEGNAPPGSVKVDPARQQVIGVRTAVVERQNLARTIHTTGQVVQDETRLAHVHVKVNGWIDQVFVNFVGQQVRKGDPLFTFYSPDLVATQEEYLIAKRGDSSLGASPFKEVSRAAGSLLRASRDRLKLWDLTEEQIRKLDETGEVSRTLTFYSPITGFVLDRKAFPQTAITPETELYTVADLSSVWVNADIFQEELPYVRVGQSAQVSLSYYPGRAWRGRVAYIYPGLDPQTHTAKVRLDFANPRLELKPQMFTEVEIKVDYGRPIAVPQEAVLDSGDHQTVFIAHPGGYFEPRQIKIGPQVDGQVVVLSGLKPGETIVTSGNFLVDSESQLKNAMGGMQH